MKRKKKAESITSQNPAAAQLSKKLRAQFMRNNRLNFAGAVAATLMAAVINLVLSWLLQQIIDASTGKNQTFDLLQLLFISSGTAILLVAILMLNGKPTLVL